MCYRKQSYDLNRKYHKHNLYQLSHTGRRYCIIMFHNCTHNVWTLILTVLNFREYTLIYYWWRPSWIGLKHLVVIATIGTSACPLSISKISSTKVPHYQQYLKHCTPHSAFTEVEMCLESWEEAHRSVESFFSSSMLHRLSQMLSFYDNRHSYNKMVELWLIHTHYKEGDRSKWKWAGWNLSLWCVCMVHYLAEMTTCRSSIMVVRISDLSIVHYSQMFDFAHLLSIQTSTLQQYHTVPNWCCGMEL